MKNKIQAQGYAAKSASSVLEPFSFERREPGPNDVSIEIEYCGVCHSDIHQAKNEWGNSIYPMVPGHEIVGKITKVGSAVQKFKVGDLAGVGCLVDSCRTCPSCQEGLEQYCDGPVVLTYNGVEKDGKTPTYGGYSTSITVDENYTLKIPSNIALERAAPLLCAGITTYSPLKQWNVQPGQNVGVIGLGGLGHMAVQIAAAMGAHVTVLSSSDRKKEDAKKLGAANYLSGTSELSKYAESLDLIINTVSAKIDLDAYFQLLKRDGTMVMVGLPDQSVNLQPFGLVLRRKRLAGSLIGGIKETQEMLDFCSKHNLGSYVEVIPVNEINTAYERMLKGDVRYRFVIDLKTLK